MKKKLSTIISTIFLLSCSNNLFNGKRDIPIICWEHPNLLQWNDFEGEIPNRTLNAAETHVLIRYKIISKKSVIVECCMDRTKSWVNLNSATDSLLIHEQYHFNLAEIYARKIRREMSNLDTLSISNTKEIYEKWLQLHWSEQARYDKETNFSKNRQKQQEWQNHMEKELEELAKFQEGVVFIY